MKYKQRIINGLIITLGNVFLAIGIGLFILPFGIDNGGISGISVILQRFFDPVLVITVLNWILFFTGWIFLKKEFALKTLISVIVYPVILNFLYHSPLPELIKNEVNNPLLAAILGALAVGVGLGIVYRVGGSTGGVDVISVLLYRFKGIKISLSTFFVDFIIVTLGLFTVSIGSALYGIICVILTSYLIEVVTIMGNSSYMIHIVSKEYKLINEYIINDLSRGSTIIQVKGGFDNTDKQMIEVIISEKEFYKVKTAIEKIDKEAFVSVYKAVNVYGNGFQKLTKK